MLTPCTKRRPSVYTVETFQYSEALRCFLVQAVQKRIRCRFGCPKVKGDGGLLGLPIKHQ